VEILHDRTAAAQRRVSIEPVIDLLNCAQRRSGLRFPRPIASTARFCTSLLGVALMFGLGTPEMLIFAAIILILFANRIPAAMRSIGSGLHEFKKGLNSPESDELAGS
jgi:sec-independent protein translocase protein TatA